MRSYYNYDDDRGGAMRAGLSSGWTGTVKALIVANAVAFLVELALCSRWADMDQWLGFYLPNLLKGAWWQPVSYMFVHADFWHLFWNMLGLYFFAGAVERALGRWPFLLLYLLCGLGGAALSLLQPSVIVIGASGGVLGLVVAYAVLFPDAYVLLFFIIPVRARYLAVVFVFIAVASLLAGSSKDTAEWAHLGGMVVAFAFLTARPAGRRVLDFLRVRRERYVVRRTEAEQAELDRILEKVHREGITALSNPERDFLNLMSRKGRERR